MGVVDESDEDDVVVDVDVAVVECGVEVVAKNDQLSETAIESIVDPMYRRPLQMDVEDWYTMYTPTHPALWLHKSRQAH